MIENSSIFYSSQDHQSCQDVYRCAQSKLKMVHQQNRWKNWDISTNQDRLHLLGQGYIMGPPQTKNKNTTAFCLPKAVSSAATLADLLLAMCLLNLNMMCDKIEFIGFLCVSTTATKIHSETTTQPLLFPPLHSYIAQNKVGECQLLTAFSGGKLCKFQVMNLIGGVQQTFRTFAFLEPARSTLTVSLITITRIVRHTIIILYALKQLFVQSQLYSPISLFSKEI